MCGYVAVFFWRQEKRSLTHQPDFGYVGRNWVARVPPHFPDANVATYGASLISHHRSIHGGFHGHGGTPKWLVYRMFGRTPIYGNSIIVEVWYKKDTLGPNGVQLDFLHPQISHPIHKQMKHARLPSNKELHGPYKEALCLSTLRSQSRFLRPTLNIRTRSNQVPKSC